MKRILSTLTAVVIGLVLYAVIFQRPVASAMLNKVSGGDQPCPWAQLAKYPWAVQDFEAIQKDTAASQSVVQKDPALPIQQWKTPDRHFWIRNGGGDLDGRQTLAYVLAEQRWISKYAGQFSVKPGNVVVDVGAHIGTFGDDALRRGASKVILVEPDPINVECIRRNFAKEIAEGKVVVVPEGAWSSRSTLEFAEGVANSGTGSFVLQEKGSTVIKVPVRPLDEILAGLGVGRVDFIKMDIEGAEREALRGARETLGKYRPVLMLDHYHLPDDNTVLPKVIAEANPKYEAACPLCSPDRLGSAQRFVPYVVFYR